MTYLRAAKRMRLSKYGEIRGTSRLLAAFAELDNQPETSRLWHDFGRSFTMAEITDIEIIEPRIQIENEVSINLDESTSQAIYALCWERFEKTLVELNSLYNATPSEGQKYAFNRVKRLLWASREAERYADALFSMTAVPDDFDPDEEDDS